MHACVSACVCVREFLPQSDCSDEWASPVTPVDACLGTVRTHAHAAEFLTAEFLIAHIDTSLHMNMKQEWRQSVEELGWEGYSKESGTLKTTKRNNQIFPNFAPSNSAQQLDPGDSNSDVWLFRSACFSLWWNQEFLMSNVARCTNRKPWAALSRLNQQRQIRLVCLNKTEGSSGRLFKLCVHFLKLFLWPLRRKHSSWCSRLFRPFHLFSHPLAFQSLTFVVFIFFQLLLQWKRLLQLFPVLARRLKLLRM